MIEKKSAPYATPSMTFDAAIFIGRFQPPHLGHLAMLRHALSIAPQVILVLGSSYQSRTPKNPFTWQERRDMVYAMLTEQERVRVSMLPMRDFYDETHWVQAVRSGVQRLLEGADTVTTPERNIALVGHFKDDSSTYLAHFPKWSLVNLPRQNKSDASLVREAYFDIQTQTSERLQQIFTKHLPESVQEWLLAWRVSDLFYSLQQEWRMLNDYKKMWSVAPFEPIFVTVDALVQCQGRVLLVERGHAPGKGLFALPGGFIEPSETLLQSCFRELQEETCLTHPAAQLEAAFRSTRVFDHPYRSLRGRTITHVFHFDLGHEELPEVQGKDDARAAMWIPIQEISRMPEKFFDDHFFILDIFLQLTHEVSLSRN